MSRERCSIAGDVARCGVFLLIALYSHASDALAQGSWTQLGLEGGEIRAVAIDPQTPTTVYVGTLFGGVFRSTNGGAGWTPVNNGLTNTNAFSIAVDPVTPSIIYVGTDAGVFRSSDRGDTWLPTVSGAPIGAVRGIVVDPAQPSTLVAFSDLGAVIRSTDGGRTWTSFKAGLPDNTATALTIDPQSSTLYLAIRKQVFRSVGGANWSSYGDLPIAAGNVSELYVDGGDSPVVYAISGGEVYRKGAMDPAWMLVHQGFPGISNLQVDVGPPYIMYGSEFSTVYQSASFGAGWTAISSGLPVAPEVRTIRTLKIDPQTPSTLYALVDGAGVYKSVNSGVLWSRQPGVTAQVTDSLVVDPHTPGRVYAGTRAGLFRSDDSGVTWSPLSGSGVALVADPHLASTLYRAAGGAVVSIGRSSDGGATWTSLPIGSSFSSVSAIAVDPQTPGVLLASADFDVYRSTDHGLTWARSAVGSFTPVRSLAIDPQITTVVYAGTQFTGVFRSGDGGRTWTSAGLANLAVRQIAIRAGVPSVLYAATSNGLFVSVNGGAAWTSAGVGLPQPADVRSIAIDPQFPETMLVAVYGSGVFRTTDGGATWATHNTGMTSVQRNVQVVAVDPALPSIMFAGTAGSSVLRRVELPTLTAMVPPVLVRGVATPVTITGTNLDQFQTTLAAMADVTVSGLEVRSRTQLTAVLTVAGSAALGARDLVAVLPYASSNALTIQVADPYPDLSVSGPSATSFGEGGQDTYTVTVQNIGTTATTGPTTVTTTLPAGLTYVSAGAGWSCGASGAVVQCQRAAPVAASESVTLTLTLAVGSSSGGAHTVAVSTAGDLHSGNDSVVHTVGVVGVPVPRITLSSTPVGAGQQVTASVTVATPFPYDLTGTLTLGFAPNAVIAGDDPAIQFATGGRQVPFVIPAQTLTARFAGSAQSGPIGFQTGTVAGTLSLSGTVRSGNVQVAFTPALPEGALTITREAPAILTLETRTEGGFAAYALVSATSREITSLSLQFATTTPVQLSCGSVTGCTASGSTLTLDTRALFAAWFTANPSLGSLGVLRVPLTIEGGLRGTVTLRLANSTGSSTGRTFDLP